jgi:plastocyanin
MTAGSSVIYAGLTLVPLPAASSGNEAVTLSSTAPTGLSLTLQHNSVELSSNAQAFLGMTINASQSVTPGVYNFNVSADYGTSSVKYGFAVNVVKYLVVMLDDNFSPGNLTVAQGSTVYWINLDVFNIRDPTHNVYFTSGISTTSPDMVPYDTYSYTFTAPGTYPYISTSNPEMAGTIIVTP